VTLEVELQLVKPSRKILDEARFFGAVGSAIRDLAADGHRFIARYPAQKPTVSGYRRTGTEGRSWSHEMRSGGGRIEGIIGSNSNVAPYNKWVQGKQQSREMKRRRWTNIEDLVDFLEREMPKSVQKNISRVV